MRRHKLKDRCRGYTFVELLAVLAVMSVLAAILFPVITSAKQRSYLTQDIAQMRQIYIALSLYEQDSDDLDPGSIIYTRPYTLSSDVFTSPADPYRNGIPGLSDFPADLFAGTNGMPADSLRSPFRISYVYMVPMALYEGYDQSWIAAKRSDPGFGMLSMFFYNERCPYLYFQDQIDECRVLDRFDRIKMDGSYLRARAYGGLATGCSFDDCFGQS
jgi:prepilin-type N-terminal cleavage/methylation domain-containing protein